MWHGIVEYLLFSAVVTLALNSLRGGYAASTLGGAAASSLLNLLHEAWLADWRVNIGWGPPMFIIGFVLALPVCALVGLPFLRQRRLRRGNDSLHLGG